MHTYNIVEQGRTLAQANNAIILLHGRGSTANSIITLSEEFCDDSFYIAAPQATNNSWYPFGFMVKEEMNEPWLSSAIGIVNKLIDDITQYLPVSKIFIMGFSQGACLALEVAGRHAQEYAGVVAFTGGLIGEKLNIKKYSGDFRKAKIFIGNSDNDPHVPFTRSEESKTILEELGAYVVLRGYLNMPHTIIPEEIKEVRNIIFK
jgi:phospholipase/carboxylesterase